jgi:hypothetical protein
MKTKSQPELSVDSYAAEQGGDTQRPGRRHILASAGAGLIAAAALGGTASAAPSGAASESAVSGGWLVTRHDTSTPIPIRSVFTFADGGAAVGMDIDPANLPYLGGWRAQDAHRFAVTFWAPWTNDQGVSIGTARIKAIARVNGDQLSGSYTAVVFLQGHRLHGSGTFQGTRIGPE